MNVGRWCATVKTTYARPIQARVSAGRASRNRNSAPAVTSSGVATMNKTSCKGSSTQFCLGRIPPLTSVFIIGAYRLDLRRIRPPGHAPLEQAPCRQAGRSGDPRTERRDSPPRVRSCGRLVAVKGNGVGHAQYFRARVGAPNRSIRDMPKAQPDPLIPRQPDRDFQGRVELQPEIQIPRGVVALVEPRPGTKRQTQRLPDVPVVQKANLQVVGRLGRSREENLRMESTKVFRPAILEPRQAGFPGPE